MSKRTMDLVLRILVLLLAGSFLLLANYWFIQFAYKYVFADEIVIAPFQVIGKDDTDGILGRSLASMLEAHLRKVQDDLDAAQKTIVGPPGSSTQKEDRDTSAVALILHHTVEIPTDLLEPINISVSVGGVEVGGIFSWLQRAIVRQRSLNFTVFVKGDKAVVSGDVSALTGAREGQLWIEDSPSEPDEISASVSYALIQRKLSEDTTSAINSLELAEFRELLEIVFEVADLNRKAVRGRVTESEFAPLLPRIDDLRKKVPQWHELTFLTANIAEGAGDDATAYGLYSDLAKRAEGVDAEVGPIDPKLVELAQSKADSLRKANPAIVSDAELRFKNAVSSYAKKLKLVPADLNVEVVTPTTQGVLAIWNTEANPPRYEVSRDILDTPGLPENVALMGRFLAKNYERCFGGNGTTERDVAFWNEFRNSVVGFLVRSEQGADPKAASFAEHYPLYKRLHGISRVAGANSTRSLALTLLDQYDCDWTAINFVEKVRAINQERNLIPEKDLLDGLTTSVPTSTAGRRIPAKRKSRGRKVSKSD